MNDPNAPKFPARSEETERLASTDVRENPFFSSDGGSALRIGPVTLVLIAICVAVAIYTSLGENVSRLLPLFIGTSPHTNQLSQLTEVRQGEFWRLFTPMFIHFGVLHIVFNLLWLKDFGTAIEHRQGAIYFLLLVLVLSGCSDLGQYLYAGPYFGGMSGVVYGLFGYVWLRSWFNPASGYRMATQTTVVMLGWFALCVAGIIPHVANVAHGTGLAAGAACGTLAAALSRGSGNPVS